MSTAEQRELLEKETKKWYEERCKRDRNRDDLFLNPEVLFQVLAYDVAVISAVRCTNVDAYWQ